MSGGMSLEKNLSMKGIVPFFRANRHLFGTRSPGNNKCLIDGKNFCHQIWLLSQRYRLQDGAYYAHLVRTFFKLLEAANIKPLVASVDDVRIDISRPFSQSLDVFHELHRPSERGDLGRNGPTSTPQSKAVFAEVLLELGIETICLASADEFASRARALDAFLIARHNRFFFADIPQGYADIWLNEELLESVVSGRGVMSFKLFSSQLFLQSLSIKGQLLNAAVLDQLQAILEYDNNPEFGEFTRRCGSLVGSPKVRLNSAGSYPEARRILLYADFLARRSPRDAVATILGMVHPNRRAAVREIFAKSLYGRERNLAVKFEETEEPSREDDAGRLQLRSINCREAFSHGVSRLDDFLLETLVHGKTEIANPVGDQDVSELPEWFCDILHGKSSGLKKKYLRLIGVITHGVSCSTFFPQDVERAMSSECSLRIRGITYGILLKDRVSGIDQEAVHVKEMIFDKGYLLEKQVSPIWEIPNGGSPDQVLPLPNLDEIGGMDLEDRKQLFSLALVGSTTPKGMMCGLQGSNGEFNMIILKYWASCPGVERIDVVALLLSLILVENRYGIERRVLPFSIPFLDQPSQIGPQGFELSEDVDPKLIHAFAQLQSICEDAFCLHTVLNSPFGPDFERIRCSLSELKFYAIRRYLREREGRNSLESCLSAFFTRENGEKFMDLVDGLKADHCDAEGTTRGMGLNIATQVRSFDREKTASLLSKAIRRIADKQKSRSMPRSPMPRSV